ncbi:MAG: UDP-N-acetylmuramoyl-L-alanine--D-glutamate ligase, partial [bacterium]|nr:UDP-N-acetylmuramoyl-L-alanine--D-glutamate ligase [bacterium]
MTKKNNNYRGMCIAVAGFGKTGRALLDFLLETKEYGTLYLFNDESLETGEQADSRKEYENRGVTFIIGSGYFSQLESAGLVIVSPGVDARTPRFELLRKKGIKIVSEIEFACTFIEAPVIAVTGTNGKSTTVSLIHHMLSKNGVNSFLAGNIGTPLISEVGKISADAVVVVEVSSFQLEEIEFFRPHIALILNITPDHLDRYHSMEDYITAKLNVGKNQDNGDFLILNAGDPLLKERGEAIGAARKVWFSRSPEDTGAVVRLEGDWIHLDVGAGEETVSLIRNPLRGVHNLENLLAAVITVRLMGVPAKGIETAVEDFEGLEHRMETVEKIGHVEFINDSKATNVDAALKSVAGIDTHM